MPWEGNHPATPERYWAVCIRVPQHELEAAASWLMEFGVAGVQWEDGLAVTPLFADGPWQPAEAPHVTAYFPEDESWAGIEQELRAMVVKKGWQLELNDVASQDWEHAWKAFYQPIALREGYAIVPEWIAGAPFAADKMVRLDPGMAFGTGTHATTRSCLDLLIEHGAAKPRVLDLGSGSGILALAAAKLGAFSVDAVEPDPVAVRALTHNIELNGMQSRIRVIAGTFDDLEDDGGYQIILMNLIRELIIPLWPKVQARLAGYAILSGILEDALGDIETVIDASGCHVAQYRLADGWATLRVTQ